MATLWHVLISDGFSCALSAVRYARLFVSRMIIVSNELVMSALHAATKLLLAYQVVLKNFLPCTGFM